MSDRRTFLKLSLPSAAAAAALTAAPENVFEAASADDVERARATEANRGIIRAELPGYLERRADALYDRVRVPAGGVRRRCYSDGRLLDPDEIPAFPVHLPLFVDAIGQHPPGSWGFKSILETNMVRGNCLPPTESHLVERILFLFLPSNDQDDIAELVSKYWFEFRLDDKIVARATLALCPVVGEFEDLISVNDRSARPFRRAVSLPYCFQVRKPIYIAPLQHFSFGLYTNGTDDAVPFVPRRDMDFYVFLDGTREFSVQ